MITLAERITAVSSFKSASPLLELLQVLQDELPVRMVTLWKIKLESGHLCARERVSVGYDPAPLRPSDEYEFVCPLAGSELAKILSEDGFKSGESRNLNLKELQADPFFFPSERARRFHLDHCVVAPIPLLTRRFSARDPAFFLAIYPQEHSGDLRVEDGAERRKLVQAIQNKISSTLSSIIELKINRITSFFTTMPSRPGLLTLRNILRETVEKLLPNELSYEKAFVFWRDVHSSNYDLVESQGLDCGPIHMTEEDIKILNQYASTRREVSVTHEHALADTPVMALRGASSVICAPISNNLSPERPIGYIILVTKLSPLARRLERTARIRDYFDWEDIDVLNHVSSMIGFISELLLSDERRKILALQFAHETLMPALFIYNTAENFLAHFDDQRKLPPLKRRAYLRNIYQTSSLQIALVQGVLLGVSDDRRPPAKRYHPTSVDLQVLAREVARMTFPLCRKQRVRNDGIEVLSLPTLFIDRVAMTQIFLNLISNAIKYTGGDISYDSFRITVSGQYEPATVVPEEIRRKHGIDSETMPEFARDPRFGEGYLISVEDDGIGIPVEYEERIFDRHFRVPGIEEYEPRGSGLGLAIVRRIIKDHFGAIWIENVSKPTRFCIYLPNILEGLDYVSHPSWVRGPQP